MENLSKKEIGEIIESYGLEKIIRIYHTKKAISNKIDFWCQYSTHNQRQNYINLRDHLKSASMQKLREQKIKKILK